MRHRLTRPMVAVLAALLIFSAAPPANAVGHGLRTEAPLTGQIICLDPGHCGADPGAFNASYELRESDINLDVAHALAGLLRDAGAAVVMTRTGNQGKIERERAEFCNQARATALISVHTNSVADPGPNGVLTLHYKPADVALAQALYDALYATLAPAAPVPAEFTAFGARRYRAGVLRRSTMPAALVEPAFISAPAEARLLATPIYTAPGSGVFSPGCPAFNCRRGQIVQALYRGILAYFEA